MANQYMQHAYSVWMIQLQEHLRVHIPSLTPQQPLASLARDTYGSFQNNFSKPVMSCAWLNPGIASYSEQLDHKFMKASVGSFLLPIQVVCAQINMMCLCIRQSNAMRIPALFQATSGNAHKLQVEDECSRIHWRGSRYKS